MKNYRFHISQFTKQELSVVVNAPNIKSIKENWKKISPVVDDYCWKGEEDRNDMDETGAIKGTDIYFVDGTVEYGDGYGEEPSMFSEFNIQTGSYHIPDESFEKNNNE